MSAQQEALTNIAKHARANRATLSLTTEGDTQLTVADDGVGFRPTADGGHYGLQIMRDRATQIGAQLNVTSFPDHGTTLTLTLPGVPPTRRTTRTTIFRGPHPAQK